MTLAELIETHTRKIHLLVVDGSLTDYHHEHPHRPARPEITLSILSRPSRVPYLAWADLRPMPMGL
ncbi:MAG: hypothetical protein H0W66_09520 [Chthoniobacterales bacterium]|nr:hypothetical protein [Chthoniobacterales bacterium]